MTAVVCSVEWCDRPVPDQAYACQTCADKLSRALGDIPALWDELDVVLTRQARYSEPEGRGGDKALPFNPTVSELGWVLRNTLSTWCRLIAEERGRVLPDSDTPAAVAGWLLHQTIWLRHHRAGHEAVEEITSVVGKIRQAVDRPAERIYAGPCKDCNGDMYGKPGAAMVECRPCGLEYDVAEMVAWMHSELRGKLVTAREAAVLLGRMGLPVQQKTIDKWFERKRLVDHGSNAEEKRLYLFDDLVTLAANNTADRKAS